MSTQYKISIVALILLSGVFIFGSIQYPTVQSVFISLAGTSLVGASLLFALSTDRFFVASVSRGIAEGYCRNISLVATERGYLGSPRYVRTSETETRLFIPESDETPTPPAAVLESQSVSTDEYGGLSMYPVGQSLIDEYDEIEPGFVEDPAVALETLAEVIVKEYELATGIDKTGRGDDWVRYLIEGSQLGDSSQLDHPIQSFMSVGLTYALETPVQTEVVNTSRSGEVTIEFGWTEPVREDSLAETYR